jgi:hypothetical protein
MMVKTTLDPSPLDHDLVALRIILLRYYPTTVTTSALPHRKNRSFVLQ